MLQKSKRLGLFNCFLPTICSNIFGAFISHIAPMTGDEEIATTRGPKNVLGTTPGN
jgi:hypothetical protein